MLNICIVAVSLVIVYILVSGHILWWIAIHLFLFYLIGTVFVCFNFTKY